jgi:hypothetical protein
MGWSGTGAVWDIAGGILNSAAVNIGLAIQLLMRKAHVGPLRRIVASDVELLRLAKIQ